MKKSLRAKAFILAALVSSAALSVSSQTTDSVKPVNFRYSQNPKTKPVEAPSRTDASEIAALDRTSRDAPNETVSIAQKTLEIAKRSSAAAAAPTEIYKVGAGDVLLINLQNAAKDATYYTVLRDGTIDYPLAGEMLAVAGLTTDEIEDALREKIKLYENPQISVRVGDYASHSMTVLGLVEKAGEKRMQREAVPLYVVRAEAVVQAKATDAIVRRAGGAMENISLKDARADEVLIFPGDIVEFVVTEAAPVVKTAKFYYIGGEVLSGGQKDFHEDLTLTQAILASGGLRKPAVKRVVVRRKNAQGLLEATEYNLKLIKDGKQLDPTLKAGDTIEIGL